MEDYLGLSHAPAILYVGMATQLVKLPDVEKLSPLVIRILGGNPGKVCQSM